MGSSRSAQCAPVKVEDKKQCLKDSHAAAATIKKHRTIQAFLNIL